jgi:hypothetical protein
MKYIITKEQRDNFLQIMRNNMQDPDAYDAIAEIESLPVLEGEAVAWIITSEQQDGKKVTHAATGRYKDVLCACDFGDPIPLYIHPAPFTPVTVNDVTNE